MDKVKKLWCYRRFCKDYTSLFFKSVRFPKPEIFLELFWTNLQSPMFSSFPAYGKHCFQCQFYFQEANHAYATRQGILTKIQACEQLQKLCEHEQVSTRLIFASNSSKGQILRALSNWMGPFDTSCHYYPRARHRNVETNTFFFPLKYLDSKIKSFTVN